MLPQLNKDRTILQTLFTYYVRAFIIENNLHTSETWSLQGVNLFQGFKDFFIRNLLCYTFIPFVFNLFENRIAGDWLTAVSNLNLFLNYLVSNFGSYLALKLVALFIFDFSNGVFSFHDRGNCLTKSVVFISHLKPSLPRRLGPVNSLLSESVCN